MTDHEVYPTAATMIGLGKRSRVWINDLEEYTASKWPQDSLKSRTSGLFSCPGYNRIVGFYQRFDLATSRLPFGSYGYNFYGSDRGAPLGLGGNIQVQPPQQPEDIRPIAASEVKHPDNMVALGDSIIGKILGVADLAGVDDLSYGLSSPSIWGGFLSNSKITPNLLPNKEEMARDVQAMRQRHHGLYLVAYCDGHVESRRIKALFDTFDDSVRKSWNNDGQAHRELIPPNLR